MSKLYTEEQVKRAYFKGASDCHDKCINRNWRGVELAVDVKHLEELNDEYINSLTPIQLPTDEEIEESANGYIVSKWEYAQDENKESFIEGAKWMRDRVGEQGR